MLQRVSIQNFKSLKDVTLDLQKVNLLIGPNNSGKTNFLKALEFGGDKMPPKNAMEFKSTSYLHNEQEMKASFLNEKGYGFILSYKLVDNGTMIYPQRNFNWIKMSPETSSILVEEEVDISLARELHFETLKQVSSAKLFRPNPLIYSKPVSPKSIEATTLSYDCSNLTLFLYNLSQSNPREYNKFFNDFSLCVSDFKRIGIPFIDNLFWLKLFDANENEFLADDVSEGVLYFLALLAIVHQPIPPKLLLLEEPERGIHPRRIMEVMNFIYDLAEEKDVQIILTTHNEHVLNDFATRPEAVFVFDKNEEGATEVRNLQKDIIEPSNLRSKENGFNGIDFTSNLGDNWLYGILGGVPENL